LIDRSWNETLEPVWCKVRQPHKDLHKTANTLKQLNSQFLILLQQSPPFLRGANIKQYFAKPNWSEVKDKQQQKTKRENQSEFPR
jgi:hypothetical protein